MNQIPCVKECRFDGMNCDGWPGCPILKTPTILKRCEYSTCPFYGKSISADCKICTTAGAVNHPSHYGGDTPYETIKVIEAWKLNFNLGNAVKCISRAGKKNDLIEDLEKARFYLDREINNIKNNIK